MLILFRYLVILQENVNTGEYCMETTGDTTGKREHWWILQVNEHCWNAQILTFSSYRFS